MNEKRRPNVARAASGASQRAVPGSHAAREAPQVTPAEPSHFPLNDLRWSRDEGWMRDSVALLCRHEATTAIVFVHGFAGAADSTWEQFPRALRGIREAASADAFFVDYCSTTDTIAFCAGQLRQFLLDLLRDPSTTVVDGSLPEGAPLRAPAARYAKILLVGHSMGAVVARRALLDLDRDDLQPDDRRVFRMLFFAPAHKGARDLGRLVESALGLDRLPFGGVIGGLLRLRYRSVADLTKQSECLVDLALDSKARRAERRAEDAGYLRATVYHAQNDRVVYDDRFDDDYASVPVMAQTHTGVCKPREGYRRPAEGLRHLL